MSRHLVGRAVFSLCRPLDASVARTVLFASSLALPSACDRPDASTTPEASPAAQPDSDLDPAPSEARVDAPAGAETITFDGMDAPGGPEDEIQAAPHREPIESFELFGAGGRGGPGQR